MLLSALSMFLNVVAIVIAFIVIAKHGKKFQNSCMAHFFHSRIERIYFMLALSILMNTGIILGLLWYQYAKWVFSLPVPLELLFSICHIGIATLSSLWHYNTLEELNEMDGVCGKKSITA